MPTLAGRPQGIAPTKRCKREWVKRERGNAERSSIVRIAIAGISHEALTFSPLLATMQDFRVLRGVGVLEYLNGRVSLPEEDVELVPILLANSVLPSGIVELGTYLQLRDEVIAGLGAAGRLDGVCLVLHGAMLVEHIGSGETDLVREIRAALGYEVLIAVRFDMHANLTPEFASKTDLWTGYRTAPHRDVHETFVRTLDLLVRALRAGERPRPVFVPVPLLLQGEQSMTADEPMRSLLAAVREVESRPGILSADLLVGFGWADAPHSGSSIVVVAESAAHLPVARAAALELATALWKSRGRFAFGQEVAASVDEAIELALGAPESCVFLSDAGDNTTAGATGDVPVFLARLLAHNVPDAVVVSIADAESVGQCLAAGVGATVDLQIGGKLDRVHGTPVPVTAVVEQIYQTDDPSEAVIVTIRVAGVRVVLTDIRRFFVGLADFHLAGIDPLAHRIVVVKLGYLMPELQDAAPRSILTLSPGCSGMDLKRLPYRYVTHPIFPLDDDFAWRPTITNAAGYGR